MECLLIDPGAYDNPLGDRWVERQDGNGKAIGVKSVGASAQIAKDEIGMPGAAKDVLGKTHQIECQAPVVPISDIPALVGQRSAQQD
eukprot:8990009-Pyramimonas_sp.AAC.1